MGLPEMKTEMKDVELEEKERQANSPRLNDILRHSAETRVKKTGS